MTRKTSLSTRISLLFAIVVALIVGGITLIISTRVNSAVNTMALADNQQTTSARAAQLGELMKNCTGGEDNRAKRSHEVGR